MPTKTFTLGRNKAAPVRESAEDRRAREVRNFKEHERSGIIRDTRMWLRISWKQSLPGAFASKKLASMIERHSVGAV